MPTKRPILLALPLALGLSLVMAGCVPSDPVAPTPAATTATTELPGPSSSATATAGPTVAPEAGEPITIGCTDLISLQAMYDYNPNYGQIDTYVPEAGTLAAQAVAANGLACRWTNQTSGDNIDVSVAHLTEAGLTARKNALVSTSNSVPTYDVEGYFLREGTTGTAQAFSDPYWIAATASGFFEPGDAAPIIADAIASLG